MATLTLKVKDDVLHKVLGALQKFSSAEVEIFNAEEIHLAYKEELENELKRYELGQAKVYSVAEADAIFERTIREYEA
jgi:hypothetical protein